MHSAHIRIKLYLLTSAFSQCNIQSIVHVHVLLTATDRMMVKNRNNLIIIIIIIIIFKFI